MVLKFNLDQKLHDTCLSENNSYLVICNFGVARGPTNILCPRSRCHFDAARGCWTPGICKAAPVELHTITVRDSVWYCLWYCMLLCCVNHVLYGLTDWLTAWLTDCLADLRSRTLSLCQQKSHPEHNALAWLICTSNHQNPPQPIKSHFARLLMLQAPQVAPAGEPEGAHFPCSLHLRFGSRLRCKLDDLTTHTSREEVSGIVWQICSVFCSLVAWDIEILRLVPGK